MISYENQVQKAITSWTDMELGIPVLQLQWFYLLTMTAGLFLQHYSLYFPYLNHYPISYFSRKTTYIHISICTEDLHKELKINYWQACPWEINWGSKVEERYSALIVVWLQYLLCENVIFKIIIILLTTQKTQVTWYCYHMTFMIIVASPKAMCI